MHRHVLLTLALASLLLACGTTSATNGADAVAADVTIDVLVDVAKDVAPGTDATAVDTLTDAATDVVAADVGPDVAPDVVPADVADVAPICADLLKQIAALKPALAACTVAVGCKTFEYPICGSIGCYQTPMASDADATALEALAVQATTAGCDGFHCGCGVIAPAFCLKGACKQCPPDCDGSCEELTAALLQTAHAANWCGSDSDCTVLGTGMCPVGDLPCGGLLLSKNANTADIQAVVTGYSVACGASTCKCAMPQNPTCVGGKCVVK